MAEITIDARRRMWLGRLRLTAQPVATTVIVAAISPALIRFTFPSFAAWSWRNGLATVNHDGQNPANTPLASPMSSTRMMMSSWASIGSALHDGPGRRSCLLAVESGVRRAAALRRRVEVVRLPGDLVIARPLRG